ncbi:Probable carboxylesterase Os04g0669600 [Durusdinium trenchii]|uniref:Probable carboxylesterase Os04g0669600 n=1 Tax=Durusdinium trenchii TaxID=1381693 RepID=A0ABP0JWV1_9DINO
MFVTLALPQRSALPSSTWCASHGSHRLLVQGRRDAKGSTLPWQLWALCLAKPGFRRIRALTRRQGYAAGEVIEVPPLTTEDEAIVVWLHGFGDTGQRWAGCVPALQQMGLPMLRFLFPTAPLTGVGSKELRTSWFDLSTLDLTERRRQTPEQLLEGVDYVLHLVEPHVRRGISPGRVFLVGYSQGGGLALASALRAPRKIGGVLMLSSWVAEPLPSDFQDVPVHFFHGAEDPVVTLSGAKDDRQWLESRGLRTTFHAYPGMSHGVCDEEVADIAQTFYEAL